MLKSIMSPSMHVQPCHPALLKEYVSLSFSADGKMLLAQGGAPEYNLVLWVWEKSKVAAVTKTTNKQGLPVHNVRSSSHHECLHQHTGCIYSGVYFHQHL